MATIEQNLTKLVNARTSIANAITAKGGTVAQGDGFEEFPADIATIPAGGGSVPTSWNFTKPNFKAGNKRYSKRFVPKTWTGLTSFTGENVWSDGTNVYYSSSSNQYVLNKATSTWSTKTWSGSSSFAGKNIWSDGTNIYLSNDSTQKVLNIATSTWSNKSWSGLTSFTGVCVWTDGENIYYSKATSSNKQYVLDKSTGTWSAKTWSGDTTWINGDAVWTDGLNIYYTSSNGSYILDKSTSTWTAITFETTPGNFSPTGIWTDGEEVYFYTSDGSAAYKFVSSIPTWTVSSIPINTTGTSLIPTIGSDIWTDGDNIYYSANTIQSVLTITENTITIPSTKAIKAFS